MPIKGILAAAFICACVIACNQIVKTTEESEIISNPIIDGYYADPSIVKEGDSWFIYATKDPWGGEDLAVF
ncbi:MAG TPA: hypothetical protein PK951_08195, partial [Chitinophagaceae bacterium]|nr:hypothetical protein [Chitinophagaceae bacterium]